MNRINQSPPPQGLSFALYKLDGMGLLPTHASDWMSKLPAPQARALGVFGAEWGLGLSLLPVSGVGLCF